MGTLWWNGTFITMGNEPDVNAVYVENGIIQAIGEESALKKSNITRALQIALTSMALMYIQAS